MDHSPVLVNPNKGHWVADKELADVKTYGALDLGTNSCRMLIAKPTYDGIAIVDAFSRTVQLGRTLGRTGKISERGMDSAVKAARVCARKLSHHKVESQRLIATEATRRASNGHELLTRIKFETGLSLEVIEPAEEARLAILSCIPLIDDDAKNVLVIDIGGGSTELAWISLEGIDPKNRLASLFKLRPHTKLEKQTQPPPQSGQARIIDWISVPIGVATLLEAHLDVANDEARFALMSYAFEEALEGFLPYNTPNIENIEDLNVVATSGTVTTLAAIHLGLQRYNRNVVDGMWLERTAIDGVVQKFIKLGFAGRLRMTEIGIDRAELIMSGSAILQAILRAWPAPGIRVADRGLREGILFSMMLDDENLHLNGEKVGA